jgi:hypothetical protein
MVEGVNLAVRMVDGCSHARTLVFEHKHKLNVCACNEGIGSFRPQVDYCTYRFMAEQTQLTVVVRAVQNHFAVAVAKCRPTILESQS